MAIEQLQRLLQGQWLSPAKYKGGTALETCLFIPLLAYTSHAQPIKKPKINTAKSSLLLLKGETPHPPSFVKANPGELCPPTAKHRGGRPHGASTLCKLKEELHGPPSTPPSKKPGGGGRWRRKRSNPRP